MTDEREGNPSASSMERRKLCPGSDNLIRSLPPRPQTEEQWTTDGTEMHEALASGEESEHETVEQCREIADRFIAEQRYPASCVPIVEERLWATGALIKFSGKPDLYLVDRERALIIDYKTGRKGVTNAEDNLQLRTLAVLLDANLGPFESITVAAVQPWVKGLITTAVYERAELVDARREIVEIIEASRKQDAQRAPGPVQCHYCPALAFCPEARQDIVHAPLNRAGITNEAADNYIQAQVEWLTAHDISVLLDRFPMFEKFEKAVKAEAKFRLQEDSSLVPGYTLSEPGTREKINDMATVRERLGHRNVHPNDFIRALGMTKKALKGLLKAVGYKGKALEEQEKQVLDGCVEITTTEPKLVRVGEGREIEE